MLTQSLGEILGSCNFSQVASRTLGYAAATQLPPTPIPVLRRHTHPGPALHTGLLTDPLM